MGDNIDRWLSRSELAERYGLPIKTLAQWAAKGTGPRYARMGRHVRYRLSDVIDWENHRLAATRDPTARPVGHTDDDHTPQPDPVPHHRNWDGTGGAR